MQGLSKFRSLQMTDDSKLVVCFSVLFARNNCFLIPKNALHQSFIHSEKTDLKTLTDS